MAHYPWDQCIADMTARYDSEEIAKKVCGKIKATAQGLGKSVDPPESPEPPILLPDGTDLEAILADIEKELGIEPVKKPAKAISLDQQLSAIREAIYAAIRPRMILERSPVAQEDWWIREIYEDFAVLEHGTEHYRVDYTLNEDGTVALSEPQQVEVDWKPIEGAKCLSADAVKVGRVLADRNVRRLLPAFQFIRELLQDAGIDPDKASDEDAEKVIAERMLASGDTLVTFGGEIKALGNGRIGGYLVRFSTEDDPDLVGEFFTKETFFGPAETSLTYYEHGLDGKVQRRVLDPRARLAPDDFGVWCEAQLALRDEYEKFIYQMAEAGKAGWSSGTAPHLVERVPTNKAVWIKTWPLGLDASITLRPCEPRNAAVPLKSWTPTPLPEAGAQDAGAPASPPAVGQAGPAIRSSVEPEDSSTHGGVPMAENANPTPSPQDAALKALQDQQEALSKRVEDLLKLIQDSPALKNAGFVTPDGGTADPNVKSFSDLLTAIRRGDEKRLGEIYGAVKALGSEQGQAAGWLLPTGYNTELLQIAYEASPILKLVRSIPVSEDAGEWPSLDMFAAPTAGVGNTALAAGVVATKHEEMGTLTETEPDFTIIRWRLHDVGGFTQVSNNLNATSPAAVEALLKGLFGIAVASKKEYYLLRGNGVGEPLGILPAPAAVPVTPATSDVFAWVDALTMVSRLKKLTPNVRWIMHQSVLPDLALTGWTTGNVARKIEDLGFSEGILSEHLPQANNSGCVILADLGAYLFFEGGPLEIAFSEHFAFTNRKVTWRFNQRLDGQPWMKKPITLADPQGSFTVSPFVYFND